MILTQRTHQIGFAAHCRKVLEAARHIALFRDVVQHPTTQHLLHLIEALEASQRNIDELRARFFGVLSEYMANHHDSALASNNDEIQSRNAWEMHLFQLMVYNDNAFTKQAERDRASIPHGMHQLVANDLRHLQTLFEATRHLQSRLDPDNILDSLFPVAQRPSLHASIHQPHIILWQKLAEMSSWSDAVNLFSNTIYKTGAGRFGRYMAFTLTEQRSDKVTLEMNDLIPVVEPDVIPYDALYEYEHERTLVLQNTERLVNGLPAHDVLLYGDRGTGKSATVKSMLSRFAAQRLRMVEIPRHCLRQLPKIIELLRHRPQPFVLFIDDLSFDEGDVAYKELKAVLEGTLSARPSNVVIYATSNRRHLIQEYFSDRRRVVSDDGEVSPQDTMQEKLSLADRFGLTVVFTSPDQKEYLAIVSGLAQQHNMKLPEDELHHRALQWATWYNGRSARTAQQFILHLLGEQGTT